MVLPQDPSTNAHQFHVLKHQGSLRGRQCRRVRVQQLLQDVHPIWVSEAAHATAGDFGAVWMALVALGAERVRAPALVLQPSVRRTCTSTRILG